MAEVKNMAIIEDFLRAFIGLVVIMDPLASIPAYLALTRNFSPKRMFEAANIASISAGATLIAFIFVGPALFSFLSITIANFKVAGGIVLLIMGIEHVLGLRLDSGGSKKHYSLSLVIIGVPLITGPGALTAATLLADSAGLWVTVAAALCAIILTRIILGYADRISSKVGPLGLEVFSRIMGLLLAAIAVAFIRSGLVG
ncbi:MarC family protein [Candidatus Micrarchaeota archaeon]|nr:MarC family protein [Candidatus Micrarchaeota archaeon]MBI5177240.1 MarC family protein [Candidatus Micrarchaeota archaeon]